MAGKDRQAADSLNDPLLRNGREHGFFNSFAYCACVFQVNKPSLIMCVFVRI